MDPVMYIIPYEAFYGLVWLIRPSMDLYNLISYLIPFYDLPLLASQYVCLILNLWVSNSQHTLVVTLCLLVLGTNIHIFFLILHYLVSVLIGMTPMISSPNFINIIPCIGLVMKYPIISFVGHHSTFNSFLLIRSVMKNNKYWYALCAWYLMTYHSSTGEWHSCCLGKECLPWLDIHGLP